jgi:Tryptophan-associated transmembrane protein (Trp_oprn_chp)
MAIPEQPVGPSVPTARARRLRLYTIFAIGIVAALTLITTTQTWWTLHLAAKSLPIAGTVAAPALAALALCAIVLAAALALAGPVFRFILGLLQLLLAFTIVFSTIVSLVRPDQPSESAVQTATGVAGSESVDALIKSVTLTPWGFVATALGVVAFVLGVWLLATFRLWPVASRKYQAVRFAAADGPRDAVVDWDAMSDGTDPTLESGPTTPPEPVK